MSSVGQASLGSRARDRRRAGSPGRHPPWWQTHRASGCPAGVSARRISPSEAFLPPTPARRPCRCRRTTESRSSRPPSSAEFSPDGTARRRELWLGAFYLYNWEPTRSASEVPSRKQHWGGRGGIGSRRDCGIFRTGGEIPPLGWGRAPSASLWKPGPPHESRLFELILGAVVVLCAAVSAGHCFRIQMITGVFRNKSEEKPWQL